MDAWRKGQIAAGSRDSFVAIIASAHRFTDMTEAEWARVCLVAHDASREDGGACTDLWHDGWFAGFHGQDLISDDPHVAAGWFNGRTAKLYRRAAPKVTIIARQSFDPTGENIAPELLA